MTRARETYELSVLDLKRPRPTERMWSQLTGDEALPRAEPTRALRIDRGHQMTGPDRSGPYFVAWITVTALGYALAGIGGHFPGSFSAGSGVVAEFAPGLAAYGLLIGAVFGGVIGALQWMVLRAWLRVPWTWMVVTALGIGVTHALADGLSASWEQYPSIAAVGGAVMTVALWLTLRGRADRAVLSVVSGAVFALGVILGVSIADPNSADWQRAHLVAGAVGGAIVGPVVGSAILWKSRSARRWVTP